MRIVGTHRQQPLLRQRHHLGAAGHHEILHPGHDGRGRDVGAGDARPAEAVEGDTTGSDVVAGVERRHATEVAALLADLRAGSPHDVVDVGGVEAVALDERLEHGSTEVLRVEVGEGALARFADPARGAACVDDECVSHVGSLVEPCAGSRGRHGRLRRQREAAHDRRRQGASHPGSAARPAELQRTPGSAHTTESGSPTGVSWLNTLIHRPSTSDHSDDTYIDSVSMRPGRRKVARYDSITWPSATWSVRASAIT